MLNYWEDISDTTNPYEVGLGKFVDLDQDVNFAGKEALKKIKAEGIKRKLVGLEIHSEPLSQTAEFWSVECNGEAVGMITSAVYSPDLKKNIAFAMISIECSDAGTQLTVDLGYTKEKATVVPLPFIDNRKKYLAGL